MKCKFCKAKIQKTDEICPECGKYTSEQNLTDDMGKCLKKFSCNDNLPIFIFILQVRVCSPQTKDRDLGNKVRRSCICHVL